MNTILNPSNWIDIKKMLKNRFVGLRDRDLLYTEGEMQDVLASVQQKVGGTMKELEQMIDEFATSLRVPQTEFADNFSLASGFKSPVIFINERD